MGLDRWIQIISSSIQEIRYKNGNLDVKFLTTGKIYRYYKVPLVIFNDFLNSSSAGKFFIEKIKNKFDDSKIEINDLDIKVNEVCSEKISQKEFYIFLHNLIKSGLSYSEIKNLVEIGCKRVKQAIGYFDELHEEELEKLAEEKDLDLLRILSARINLPEKVIMKLIETKDKEIFINLSQNNDIPKRLKNIISSSLIKS